MITIENATVLYGEDLEETKANVLIDDHEIIEVSPRVKKGEIIDARGCVVAPSFINSHVHLGDSVAMDLGDGKPINELIKPPNGLKHRLLTDTPRSVLINSIKKSMWDMIHSGTTTFLDFREGGLGGINLLNEAAKDIPIRKIILGRHESFLNPSEDVGKLKKTVEELLSVSDGIAPSGLGEINDQHAALIVATCKNLGKLSAIHVAEYQEVQKASLNETGKSEVERAIKAGFNILIHLTAPFEDDLELVVENKIPVVTCPRSNGMLAVGIPPIKEMYEAGINLLLGTDNLMFNSPNMLREMEYALKATRGFNKDYFSPKEILKMATVNAANALEMNLGTVYEGKIADMVIIEQKSTDPYLSIINRAETDNIKSLLMEGKIIYNDLPLN
ncbi:MAG: amidohydrolase family protein [Methanobacterium sp.]|nr:amidohydrolase family protein [Methanobacterium sp.]